MENKDNHQTEKIIYVNNGSSISSVFGGLVLFFIGLPILMFAGCTACTLGIGAGSKASEPERQICREVGCYRTVYGSDYCSDHPKEVKPKATPLPAKRADLPDKYRINATVDGYDMHTINLWKDKDNRSLGVVTQVTDNEAVYLIEIDGEYALVETMSRKRGWCNYAFLKAF